MELLGHTANPFCLLRKSSTFSIEVGLVYIPTKSIRFLFPHIFTSTCSWSFVFTIGHTHSYEVVSHCGFFICISLISTDDHFFSYIHWPCLEKCLFSYSDFFVFYIELFELFVELQYQFPVIFMVHKYFLPFSGGICLTV